MRILALLAVRIGFDPGAAGPVIAWDGGAWFDPRAAARLPAGTINGRCLDVSKSTVQRVWAEVAGYALAVDPLTHRGPIVVKSELNGMHDGRLVEGPLATRAPGLVYERLVDTGRDGVLSTIRTPVIGGRVPVTMVKWRPAPAWFGSAALTEPRPAGDMFSPAELELLARFAERLGMDYGELDVLREAATDRIFVVDANRTPVRNPRLRSAFDADIYPAMAEAFRALLPG